MSTPYETVVTATGKQPVHPFRSTPSMTFGKTIRTPSAKELAEADRRLRMEKAKHLESIDTGDAFHRVGSSMGPQAVSWRPSSPTTTIGVEARFTTGTAGPRGLGPRDNRASTEFNYDLPAAHGVQPDSRKPTTPSYTLSQTGRLLDEFKMPPTRGGSREGLASPLNVSKRLYDVDKARRRFMAPEDIDIDDFEGEATLSAADHAAFMMSSMGPQVVSSKSSSPVAVIGTSKRFSDPDPTAGGPGPISADRRAIEPRPTTASLSLSGRPKVPGKSCQNDWDYSPAGVPPPGAYDTTGSLRATKPSSPAFSLGKAPPKPKRLKNGRVIANDIFRF